MPPKKAKEWFVLPGKLTAVLNEKYVISIETKGVEQTDVKLPFLQRKLPTKQLLQQVNGKFRSKEVVLVS